jgi:hypothetical protein
MGSMGHQSQLSMGAAGTAIGSFTEAYEFISEALRAQRAIVDTAGMRGTRSHPAERTRNGTYQVSGSLRFHATPAMLDLLLPRILGAAEASDVFDLAETLPEFAVLIDRVARRFVYDGCKVNTATFRAQAGGPLEVDIEVIGKTELVSATVFPSITAPVDPPYVWHDCVFTLNGSARVVTQFELTINNALNARFSNSETATDIHSTDRIVTCNLTVPYTSAEVDLYGINTGGAGAATLVFTNGNYATTFSIPKLQIPDNSPTVNSREEILLALQGTAKKSGSTNELTVTHDSTA